MSAGGVDELAKKLRSVDLGAMFLGALAYPEDAAARDRFAGAILCKAFDRIPARSHGDPVEAVRLACVMQDREAVDRAIAKGNKKIVKERLAAAFAAQFELSDLFRCAQGLPPRNLATHAAKPMLDAIAARGGHASNFLGRAWKDTLPALDMAVALNFQTGFKWERRTSASIP